MPSKQTPTQAPQATPRKAPSPKRGSAPLSPEAVLAKTPALARHLGVTAPFLIRAAKAGLIPSPVYLNKVPLWNVADVKAALQASKGGK